MSQIPPQNIGGARVLMFASTEGTVHTARCRHLVDGASLGPAPNLAVCSHENDPGVYLF